MTDNAQFRRIKRGRWWSYQIAGAKADSVTRLIGDGIPKPNLIPWAAKMAAEYAADNIDDIARLDRDAAVDAIKQAHRRATNRAAAKGTEIHNIAESIARGETVDVPETIAGYVDAYLAFLEHWAPTVHALEGAVCHTRWLYAGTFDMLATLPTIGLAIVDIKTGGSGVWPETCLQLAAYRHAEVYLDDDGNTHPMPDTDAGAALWLADDGTYELLPVQSGPDIFATFLHAGHVAAFMKRDKDDLIGLPLAKPARAETEAGAA